MRTAKYNDYTFLRILLFIILIVLAIFACKHFVKAPCEHTGSWKTVEATCTENGYKYKECTKCGEQYDNEVIEEALGHKFDDTEIIEEATCTKTGSGYKVCSVCGEHADEFVTIPVVAHTPGDTVIKNEKHTLAEGASYEEHVYCTECDEQLSVKKVDVEHNTEVRLTVNDPTCVDKGSEVKTIYCIDCDKELSTESKELAPLGHSFAWALNYKDGEAVLEGECTAPECDHIFDPAVDTTYTYVIEKDANDFYAPNCAPGYEVYIATVSNNGEVVTTVKTVVELPADPEVEHTLYVKVKDSNGNWTVPNPEAFSEYNINEDGYIVDDNGKLINFLQYAQKDAQGIYFNISTPGIIKVADSKWDENGFAVGTFKCTTDVLDGHEHWVTVRIYNDLAN